MNIMMSFLLLCLLISSGSAQEQEGEDQGADTTDTADSQQQLCLDETIPLLEEPNLAISQLIIFEDYKNSYDDKCDIGLDKQECSIKFEGDVRTYKALCESSQNNGQVYKRPIILSCGFGAITYDLGEVPTCVSSSCNITAGDITPEDVQTEQVDAFLKNLTFTGCKAVDADSGADAYFCFGFGGGGSSHFSSLLWWSLLASVGLVQFV